MAWAHKEHARPKEDCMGLSQPTTGANPYEVLGVQKDTLLEEIKRAYRRLVLKCHPDRFPNDPTKEAEFKRLTEAFDVLSDPIKRRSFDSRTGVSLRHGTAAAIEERYRKLFKVEGGGQ